MQSNNNTDTAKKGSAQALANPAKSITKSKHHKRNIIKKWIRENTNPCTSVLSVFHFLICGPAEGQGHDGNTENYICDNIVSIRLRRGQKFKHGFHGEHGFGFFTDFLVGKCFLDFYQDFCGFASAWALPFLCWLQSLSFSNLSWPSQREGISYSTLSKTSSANYFSQSL